MFTKQFSNKKILITGVCGTIGSALAESLLSGKYGYNFSVLGIDINETELFLLTEKYRHLNNCDFRLLDIRDCDELVKVMSNVNFVIHTAALKHVVICESSPYEMIKTNINGVKNIIEAARVNSVERVLFTSSDKAVNPSSNMGASKLIGEGLFRTASSAYNSSGTIFATTRFGNVIGSRGSVISVFEHQIQNRLPLTLTHHNMTRFIMSITDAVTLVLNALLLAKGGETFVAKMPIIKIADLANALFHYYNKKLGSINPQIIEIGIKQGEKLYEELLTSTEAAKSIETSSYFIIFPSHERKMDIHGCDYGNILSTDVHNSYSSENGPYLTNDKLLEYLLKYNLLSL